MSENFADLFEQSFASRQIKPGAIIKGTVVAVNDDVVIVSAGLKSEAVIPIEQFQNEKGESDVSVGDEIDVALDAVEDGFGETRLSRDKAKRLAAWLELEEALEKGTVDAVVVDSAFSNTLKARGFSIIVELSKANIPFVSNGIVARGNFLQQQPDVARNVVKGWLEGVAYALSPKMKPAVIAAIMRYLKITDPELAERGYQDLQQATDRKPFPSLEGLRNVQRLMAQRNPAVAGLKTESLIDGRIMRELDESGFIDQLYAVYGVK